MNKVLTGETHVRISVREAVLIVAAVMAFGWRMETKLSHIEGRLEAAAKPVAERVSRDGHRPVDGG